MSAAPRRLEGNRDDLISNTVISCYNFRYMYFITKNWDVWTVYDKGRQKSRLILPAEMETLQSLFPMLLGQQSEPLAALQIANLSLARLQQTKNGAGLLQTGKKHDEPMKYVACKVASTWTLYAMTGESSRLMSNDEIAFIRSFFSTLTEQSSALVEAIQIIATTFSKIQQMATPVSSSTQHGKAPVLVEKK